MPVDVTKDDGLVVHYEDGADFGLDSENHGHLMVFGASGSLAVYAPGRWSHAEVKP